MSEIGKLREERRGDHFGEGFLQNFLEREERPGSFIILQFLFFFLPVHSRIEIINSVL